MKTKKQIFINNFIKNLEEQMKWNKLFIQYETANSSKKYKLGGTTAGVTRSQYCISVYPAKIQEDINLGIQLRLLPIKLCKKIEKTNSDMCQFSLNTQYKQEIEQLNKLIK